MSLPKISKMHKKVAGISQDKAEMVAQKNNFWDDANMHYVRSIQAIEHVEGRLAGLLSDLVGDGRRFSLIADQRGLSTNVTILNKDLKEHIDRLNTIHDKHKDRTGGTVTADDQMAVLHVNGEYTDALEIYQANIVPVVSHILEQIGATEDLINEMERTKAAEQAQQALIDPTVITDVAFREKSAQSTEPVTH
jgi:hypothetical protein